jgi:alpha-tubulin suppressor-like RCC1 family protein
VQVDRSTGRKAAAALASLLLISACGDGPTSGHPIPAEIRILSTATQSGTPGWPLPDSIVVEVLDAEGNALPGVPVTWSASNGDDKIGRPADTTNVAGRASAEWTLGWNQGEQTLSISAGDLTPVTATATATIFHAASVTVGGGFACALNENGRAFCWGANFEGEMGNGTVGEAIRTPAPVAGDVVFTALTASSTHACGLALGGVAYCWGGNDNGETGTGSSARIVPIPTPVQTAIRFTHISAEGSGNWSNSTCGLTAGGEVWCWGFNGLGKLGDGTTNNSAVPVRVLSDRPFAYLQAGHFHSCATASGNGELWCWGEQEADTGAFGARPEGLYTTPVVVHPDFRFVQLSTGRNYTCALTVQHTAFCWGANWFGSLGTDPPTYGSTVPLPVAGGHSFVSLSAAGFESTHALTADGVLYRWGSPGGDQVQATPVRVTELRFTQIDSGESDPFVLYNNGSCGVATGGAVYCVDANDVLRGVPPAAEP